MIEYKIAENYFNNNKYIDAFKCFKNIAESNQATNDEKSNAFNMLGVIILIDTRVENSDESGLKYFVKSLEFNSKNVGALFNIIEGFGLSVNNYRNIEMFNIALNTLKDMNYGFSQKEKSMLSEKIKLKEKLLRDSSSL